MRKQLRVIVGLCVVYFLFVQLSYKWIHVDGHIFGTTYSISVKSPRYISESTVKADIQAVFDQYDKTFSTYRPDSEIMHVNSLHTKAPIEISELFYDMTRLGQALYKKTNGIWDGSVFPLVKIWGFYNYDPGQTITPEKLPDESSIEAALISVGFSKLVLFKKDASFYVKKDVETLALDYSSIAKGGAVDAIADYLDAISADFMVEVGGEVYIKGESPKRMPWAIGIQHPRNLGELSHVVGGGDYGIATSGDYERFFFYQGKRYAHILDPKSGWPVEKSVISATVVSPSVAYSDGLASALMGMAPEEGIAMIESLDEVECYLITFDDNNVWSSGWDTVNQQMEK